MLIIKSKSAYEWKTIMQAISTIVDEAVFNATSEGIMFRAMDPSHVALIDIIWSSAAFESYRCDGELIFAVRVDEFLKLLKRADKDESVEVSINNNVIKSAEREGEGEEENVEPSASASTLSLKFAKENSKKSRHYRLRLLEVGSSASATVTPLPKLNFTTKVTMSLNALIDTLKDIEVISDQVTIYSNGSVVQFEGKGDTGDVKVVFEQGGDEVREIIMQEGVSESRATYSIKYLLDMVNAIDDAESVVIEYSSKIPLRLEFRLPFMCKIHYYLAPRVE
jgi:proliferating cell nuclear antigen